MTINIVFCRCRLALFSHTSSLSSPGPAGDPSVPPSWGVFPRVDWLRDVLLPKLAQWTVENQEGTAARPGKGLSLVPLDRYSALYLKLKEQYGPSLVQVSYIMCWSVSSWCVLRTGRKEAA